MAERGVMRVLLVEDDPGDATLATLALSACAAPRFQVLQAATLAEAVARLEGFDAAVILLDLSLPDSTGPETLRIMREAAPEVPIVVMTGYDDPDFADRLVGMGAQDYLIKDECESRTLGRAIRYARSRFEAQRQREMLVAELRSAVDLRNRMFGVLAHDLRNPVGVVSAAVELLEMKLGPSVRQDNEAILDMMTRGCSFILDLIEDVLALALAEAGDVQALRGRVDLREVVAEAVTRARVLAEPKGIDIQALADGGPPLVVRGDALKLGQVLNNLIGNAVKFSLPGQTVEVAAGRRAGGAYLSVRDHGGGIASDVRPHLFEPFHLGKQGTAGEPSIGLGLYICSRIMAAHGGRIEVDDPPDGGARVSAWLPVTGGA